MDESDTDSPRKISRREFLKLLGIGGAVVGLEALGATACVNFFLRRKSSKGEIPTEIPPFNSAIHR